MTTNPNPASGPRHARRHLAVAAQGGETVAEGTALPQPQREDLAEALNRRLNARGVTVRALLAAGAIAAAAGLLSNPAAAVVGDPEAMPEATVPDLPLPDPVAEVPAPHAAQPAAPQPKTHKVAPAAPKAAARPKAARHVPPAAPAKDKPAATPRRAPAAPAVAVTGPVAPVTPVGVVTPRHPSGRHRGERHHSEHHGWSCHGQHRGHGEDHADVHPASVTIQPGTGRHRLPAPVDRIDINIPGLDLAIIGAV